MEEQSKQYFYTPEEFRHILKCSRSVCYEAIKRKEIKSFRIGRKYFIPASEIDRLSRLAEADDKLPQEPEAKYW